jgi:DNA-binding HxlR family transcriptional regulator
LRFSLPALGETDLWSQALAGCILFSGSLLRGNTVARNNALRKTNQKKTAEQTRVLRAITSNAAEDGLPAFDRLIHERLRLGIVSALAVNDSMTFNELKDLMKTSDGNLSVHARKLEESGYLVCSKSFDGRTPKTEYKLTAAGKRAFERYLIHMESLLKAMRDR